MESCVFCKIVKWETPSQRVYEDDKYIAFLDINPTNWGHALLIPRQHYKDIADTPDEVLSGMIKLVKKLGPAIVKAMEASAYNVRINNGAAAGQEIDHVHFHIIPRSEDDGLHPWGSRGRYPEGEMGATARKIKEILEKI